MLNWLTAQTPFPPLFLQWKVRLQHAIDMVDSTSILHTQARHFWTSVEEWIAVTSHLAVIFVATVIDLQCTGTENLPPLILGLQFCNAHWKEHSAKWLYMRNFWGWFRIQEESGGDTKLPEKYWDEYLLQDVFGRRSRKKPHNVVGWLNSTEQR